ncbi:MAG TPA: gas vesicle protein [Microlunatus sp.]
MAESLSLRKIGKRALDELSELVGCPAEGIIGVSRHDDGWVVTVELLEMGRVPETTDVLGSYDVQLDRNGDVVGYHRVRRYLRGSVED